MNMRHLERREPRGYGFSWGRVHEQYSGLVVYRLFRRDHRRATHLSQFSFDSMEDRTRIASVLRDGRRKLRDRVDEIDLAAMGVTA